jgi:hypothetical protein
MKLAAIYNVWDGEELLPGSIQRIIDHVDEIIIVYQSMSNYGEAHDPMPRLIHQHMELFSSASIHAIHYVPNTSKGGMFNEKSKRNIGIKSAQVKGCTHFLHIDCDEYYQDFGRAKELFIASGAGGSVCPIYTYFKRPTLRFENPDGYYVPFIHALNPDTEAGNPGIPLGGTYPFHVDPTRGINETNVVEIPEHMHHFSWVRKDIHRKCRNSSARKMIERGTMLQDYGSNEVGHGYYVKDYDQKLITVSDNFNLTAIFDSL